MRPGRKMPRVPAPPEWSGELTTVGVTGTNGKTSTTFYAAAALASLCSPVAQTTTLGSFLDREPFETSFDMKGFLATMRAGLNRGGRYAAIELTSEALGLGFAKAWPCQVGVFTNLTRDHVDAHGSAEHYLASKAQLFLHLPADGTAVLNGCDPASALLSEVIPEGVILESPPSKQALEYVGSAKWGYNLEPALTFIWSDERPEVVFGLVPCNHHDCLLTVVTIFSARTDAWETGEPREELAVLWDTSRERLPDWPGFRRLQLSPGRLRDLADRNNWD